MFRKKKNFWEKKLADKNFEKKRKDLILDETIKLNSDFALHPKL